MDNVNLSSEALLSNQGDMTSFRYSNSNIQFLYSKMPQTIHKGQGMG